MLSSAFSALLTVLLMQHPTIRAKCLKRYRRGKTWDAGYGRNRNIGNNQDLKVPRLAGKAADLIAGYDPGRVFEICMMKVNGHTVEQNRAHGKERLLLVFLWAQI